MSKEKVKEITIEILNNKIDKMAEIQNNLFAMLKQKESKNIVFKNGYSNSFKGDKEKVKGITLRKDGRYVIRKCINGQRVVKYARTLNEAKKVYTALKNNKISEQEKVKIYSFKEWCKEWLETYKKPFISERSYKDLNCTMKMIIKKFGNYPLPNLTTKNIQEYINNLPKNRTKERIVLYFNAVMQKATDINIISNNPFKAVIRDKKIKLKRDSFNYEEQKIILTALKDTDIEHEIYIYLLTGCRPNELPKSENFDFTNNIITINGTKNENAKERKVEISQEFSNYIKPYIKSNKRPEHNYLVKRFKEICKANNIKNPLLYRLRHTFATNHFTIGTNPKYIQEWLGHYSVSFTLDTYTDIDKTATKQKIIELYSNYYYIIYR